jgi:predicted PurR-regulated permease PerM
MLKEKQLKNFLAIFFIFVLLAVLLYGLWPYFSALLGAFILFVIFLPLYRWLRFKLHFKRGLAAIAIIVISIIVILIPVSFLASMLIKEIPMVLEGIRGQTALWAWLKQYLPQLDATALAEQISQAGSTAGRLIFGTLAVIGNQLISYILMFFTLYFLLVTDEEKLSHAIFEWMPFSWDNTVRLQQEFKKVTRTTIITSGLIALLQGSLLALGFMFFGLGAPVLWGLVAVIASFVPMFGTSLVWLPAVLIVSIQGDWGAGIGLLAWGLVISSVDNLIRPYLQKKVGQIHPLVSILGVVIGLSIFGLVGLIIGPLLLSYFILMLKMFKEEYISG